MAGLEAAVRQWLGARTDAVASFVRMDDGAAVLAFARYPAVEVSLASVDGEVFFAESLGENAPEKVEEWLTAANTLFSDRARMTASEALDALVAGTGGSSTAPRAARADDEEMEMEGEDDDLELEDDDQAMLIADIEAAETRTEQRAALTEERKWESLVGSSSTQGSRQASQVLMREMRALLQLRGDCDKQALEIDMVDDSLYRWCVKMHADGFPNSCPLKAELLSFASKHASGAAAVVMEVLFPDSYPMNPPFIRVVRPRFQMHTGHVTIGGSICMELLTPSGWLPSVSLENVFVSIRSEMVEGGGRLDTDNAQRDYTVQEAKEAFNRVANRYGWLK